MTSLVRHHTRWCLVATAALLVAAFALHDVSAQFRPPPGGGSNGNHGGGFSGVSGTGGGVSGMSGHAQGGGFSGNHFNGGGATGTGAAGFQGHSGGFSGVGGGIGGGHFEYRCSRCNAKVSPTATRCPSCGALFTGTTVVPGSGPSTQPGGSAPQNNNPGTNSPTKPGSWADNPPPDNKPSSGSSDDKESGLSAVVIIAASIVTLGLFALIAGIVVVKSTGKAPAKKARARRFHDDEDD